MTQKLAQWFPVVSVCDFFLSFFPEPDVQFDMEVAFSGVTQSGVLSAISEGSVPPSLIPGKVGTALWMNRTALNYGQPVTECFYNLNVCTTGLTISLWVIFYEFYENQVVMVLDSGGFNRGSKGLTLYRFRYSLTIGFKDDFSYYEVWARLFSLLKWHHLVITWKNATEIEVYINGCPAGFRSTITPRSQNILNIGDFRIGGNMWGGEAERGVLAVDHLLVWYSVFTPEQVWQLYVQGGQNRPQ